MRKYSILFLTLGVLLNTCARIEAQANKNIPDFTRGDKVPVDAKHDWNLGPTGARGWIYSNKLETTEARQIYVLRVKNGSPARAKTSADIPVP